MSARIGTCGEQVVLQAPWQPEFPAAARKLGGRWNRDRRVWTFCGDAEPVRALASFFFGEVADVGELVAIRVTFRFEAQEFPGPLFVAGYAIEAGAAVLAGAIRDAHTVRGGGRTYAVAGTVLELRDVPRACAEAEIADPRHDGLEVEILPGENE